MEPLKEKEDFFEVICIFQELSTLTGSFCFNFLEVLKSSWGFDQWTKNVKTQNVDMLHFSILLFEGKNPIN